MNSLSYVNKKGDHVFTSEYHRKRGSCCKSKCLHCPFGTTIKAYGLSFENVTVENEKVAQEILDHHKGEEGKAEVNPVDTFTSDLFQKAFGGSKKKQPEKSVFTMGKEDYDQFKFILLKGSVCGLFKKKVVGNIEGVKECFLLPEFSNQGLTKDLIESFYLGS